MVQMHINSKLILREDDLIYNNHLCRGMIRPRMLCDSIEAQKWHNKRCYSYYIEGGI